MQDRKKTLEIIQLSAGLVTGEACFCSYDGQIFNLLGIPGCFYSSLTVTGWFEQTNYSRNKTN